MTTTPPSDAGAEAVLESLAAQVNKQLDMSDDALFGYLKAYGNPETPPPRSRKRIPRLPRSIRRLHRAPRSARIRPRRRLGPLTEKRTRKRRHHQDRNHRYLARNSPAG